MHSAFQYRTYLLKRQIIALTGKLRIYSPDGRLIMFSQQKMFKLREDIRVYSDESKTEELLFIQARQIIDFSAAYDVHDSLSKERIGTIRRRGWQSLARDEWSILDANEQPLAVLLEDTLQYALLRRFLLGNLLPQDYDIRMGETCIADLKQRFNLFRYELDLDFSADSANRLDRRLGVAAGVLLAIVEGKQDN
jgi:uncharacterized protein YxjI